MVSASCWVTLITKSSYIPGVIILAYSLDLHKSLYPLIVLHTDALEEQHLDLLRLEAQRSGRIVLHQVDLLLPRAGQENTKFVAERFRDTFTKLRAFEAYKYGYTRVCFLDADMAVFQNPDGIFEQHVPKDHLLANHACVCNLDSDTWAPLTWHKGNCAYTLLTHPNQVASDITTRSTYRLLNGGLFLFDASEALWTRLLDHFNTSSALSQYQFPDQDFLADFYKESWIPVSWKYNALKTMRYWHPRLWSDDKVVVLHYIVDKPWERRIPKSGIAGHLGRDGFTHQLWWDLFNQWSDTPGVDGNVKHLLESLMDQQEPIPRTIPLPQQPGCPEDAMSSHNQEPPKI